MAKKATKKKTTRNQDRLTLAPLKFEDALRALIQTKPTAKKGK